MALAAHIFEVPSALDSLIDKKCVWFESCIGLNAKSMKRDRAFCDYTIHHDEVFVAGYGCNRNSIAFSSCLS